MNKELGFGMRYLFYKFLSPDEDIDDVDFSPFEIEKEKPKDDFVLDDDEEVNGNDNFQVVPNAPAGMGNSDDYSPNNLNLGDDDAHPLEVAFSNEKKPDPGGFVLEENSPSDDIPGLPVQSNDSSRFLEEVLTGAKEVRMPNAAPVVHKYVPPEADGELASMSMHTQQSAMVSSAAFDAEKKNEDERAFNSMTLAGTEPTRMTIKASKLSDENKTQAGSPLGAKFADMPVSSFFKAAPESKKKLKFPDFNRAKVVKATGAIVVSIFSVYFMYTQAVENGLIESEPSVQPVDLPPPVKKNKVVAKDAPIDQKNPAAAVAGKKPTPIKGAADKKELTAKAPPAEKSVFVSPLFIENGSAVDSALQRGDARKAVKAFGQPHEVALSEDKIPTAHFLQARYYLLANQPRKAQAKLAPYCDTFLQVNAVYCAHHIRTLISLGQYKQANILLDKAKEPLLEGVATPIEEEIYLLDKALSALSKPTIGTLERFVKHLAVPSMLSSEWRRQSGVWVTKAFSKLSRKERHIVGKRFLVSGSQSEEIQKMFLEAETNRDIVLLSYFRYLAADMEIVADVPLIRPRNRIEPEFLSALFLSSSELFRENEASILKYISYLNTHTDYQEMAALISFNAALDEGDMPRAYRLYSQYKGKRQLTGEWALFEARLVLKSKREKEYLVAHNNLNRASFVDKRLTSEFSYWYLKMELMRALNLDFGLHMSQLEGLALTGKEMGFVSMMKSMNLEKSGRLKEAISLARQAIAKDPNHPPLMNYTAILIRKAGFDNTFYVESQLKIPGEYWKRSQEMPPVSDTLLMGYLKNL